MLTATEKKIIDLMRAKRQTPTSLYDYALFSDDEAKQRQMLLELKSQLIYSDVDASMPNYYGAEAVELLKSMK